MNSLTREHSIITLAENQTPPPLLKPQWDKCPSGTNVPVGQMSRWDKCPSGTNVQWDKCPVGQMSSGTNVSGTTVSGNNVCGTNVTPPSSTSCQKVHTFD